MATKAEKRLNDASIRLQKARAELKASEKEFNEAQRLETDERMKAKYGRK